MSICTECTAIDPGVGYGVPYRVTVAAEHARYDGRRCNAHEQHVVEAHAVVTVFEREDTLDLVRLDGRGQDIAHREQLAAFRTRLAAQVIGNGEDATQVIGGMAPLSREPGVVEVEPAIHGADIERRHDGLEFVRRAGDAGTARQRRAGHDGAHELGAGRVVECLEAAGQGIQQAVVGGLERKIGIDLVVADVVGDVGEGLVPVGTDSRADISS